MEMERLLPGFDPLPSPLTSTAVCHLLTQAINMAKNVPRHAHQYSHVGAVTIVDQYKTYSQTPWQDPVHPGMSPAYTQYQAFPTEVQKAEAKKSMNGASWNGQTLTYYAKE